MALKRSTSGMTITELMVSTLLMGFTMAAVGEMVVLNTYMSTKLTNSIDGQAGCSRAIRRLSEDVRAAQIVGSASNAQTLILQQPTFYRNPTNGGDTTLNGFPLLQQSGTSVIECVDTITYQVVQPDASKPVYQLEVTRVPGNPTIASLGKPALSTEVVLTGITGPLDPAGGTTPALFQYLPTSYGPPYTPPYTATATYTYPPLPSTPSLPTVGVSISIEVQTPPSGIGANIQRVGSHVETYLRSSTDARLTNN